MEIEKKMASYKQLKLIGKVWPLIGVVDDRCKGSFVKGLRLRLGDEFL